MSSNDSKRNPMDPRRRMSRPSLVSHPDRSLASRLTRLSILEPTTREVGVRPVRWSLLAIPLVAVGLVFAVREVSKVERVLAAEGSRSQRVIVYEIRPGGEVRVPIEPGTEVFRVVAHAMKKGALTNAPHAAHLVFTASGEKATRTDEMKFDAPGSSARVTPEDGTLVVGDPVAINVDAHGLGTGELKIALASVVDADAILVRIYRREKLDDKTIADRPSHLRAEGKWRLAHHAGEVDWDELESSEQSLLLGARWRRVAALPNTNKGLVTHAVAVASPQQKNGVAGDPDPALLSYDVRGDEKIAFVAKGKTSVRVRADGDAEAKVVATVRHYDGRVLTVEGKGEITVDVPADEEVGIELNRSTPGVLSMRSTDPSKIEPSSHAAAWRTSKDRPLIVKAGGEPLVLRISARRAVPRNAVETFSIVLDATITAPDQGFQTVAVADAKKKGESIMLHAERPRSVYERYDGRDPSAAPTTSAVFHVLVPAKGTLTLTPAEGAVDVSLSELDPGATPRPVPAYAADKPWPKVQKVGDIDWGGFVSRRPSNYTSFESIADGRSVIRLPHRLVPIKEPETKAPEFRVKRPEAPDFITRSKRIFDPTTAQFEIDVPAGEAMVLPVRAFAHEKMDLIAKVDGVAIDRRSIGAAERVTTGRAFTVEDEVRTVVVLGDDLTPGKHILTFEPPPGKKAWIHLPWTAKPRLPGAPPPDPHWIEGDLED
jgi:hypothetical protein